MRVQNQRILFPANLAPKPTKAAVETVEEMGRPVPQAGVTSKRSSRLICKTACRAFLLDMAQAKRPGKFNRVEPAVYDRLEAQVRNTAASIIQALPNKGKTIRL